MVVAKREIPEKRKRREELQAKMSVEDSILEAVRIKKEEAEKLYREINDEKVRKEKQHNLSFLILCESAFGGKEGSKRLWKDCSNAVTKA